MEMKEIMRKRLMILVVLMSLLLCPGLLWAQEKKPEEITSPRQTKEPSTEEPKVTPELKTQIEVLIKQLGANDWQKREAATKGLIKTGKSAILYLEEALKNQDDLEIRVRAEKIIEEIVFSKLRFVFVSEDCRLWLVRGQDLTRIIPERRYSECEGLSPDGKRAVCVWQSTDESYLDIVDLNNGEVIKTYEVSKISSAAWAADSKRVAFFWADEAKQKFLSIVSPSGDERNDFLIKELGFHPTLSWSPDGTRIAFSKPFTDDIYLIDTAGGELQRLVTNAYRPIWVDNNTLLYLYYPSNAGGAKGINTIDIITTNIKQLYKGECSNDLRFSAGTKKIAYRSGGTIFTLDPETQEAKRILVNTDLDLGENIQSLELFTADGNFIIFETRWSKRTGEWSGEYKEYLWAIYLAGSKTYKKKIATLSEGRWIQ